MRNLYETVNFTQHPKETENPLESIHAAITGSSRDMALCKRDAWIYGIAVGWDDASYAELQQDHGWTDGDIGRNKRLHQKYIDSWLYIEDEY